MADTGRLLRSVPRDRPLLLFGDANGTTGAHVAPGIHARGWELLKSQPLRVKVAGLAAMQGLARAGRVTMEDDEDDGS